jgi:hypothetical protein
MSQPVKMSFERQVVVLPLSDILPVKRVPDSTKQTSRYKRIVASILEVGIVETLGRRSAPQGNRTLYVGRRPSEVCRSDGPRQE